MKRLLIVFLAAALLFSCTACGANQAKTPLDPKNPATITVWNYYNGDQLAAFDALVSAFNNSVGVEKGITVVSVSQGSIDNLASSLLDAAEGKIGAQDLPTMAAIYAETAYILDKKQLLVNLDDYFSAEELKTYVPGFIEEGRLTANGPLMLFPISKSTECFAANVTDWADFAAATGVEAENLATYEQLADAAGKYYEWTDGLTPDVPEDGKALYGRDSVANYLYIGAKQLGHELFTVTADGMTMDLDRATLKKLWDNYYIPFINGYFAAEAKFRSEDMKTGTVLAVTCSSSGVGYLPTAVTDENDQRHSIKLITGHPLYFDGVKEIAVQQGAGYCVIKGTEAQQYAAAQFLKWFTDSQRNLDFSVASGYSAVTLAANNAESIRKAFVGTGDTSKDENILSALLVSADIYLNVETSTNKPFDGSMNARNVLGDALSSACARDRAAVKEAIAAGQTRAEATAQFCTEEYFDAWYGDLCAAVNKAVGK